MFVLILLFWNLVATLATKPEFLVAKEKMLVALATISVTISSPATFIITLSIFVLVELLATFFWLKNFYFFILTYVKVDCSLAL